MNINLDGMTYDELSSLSTRVYNRRQHLVEEHYYNKLHPPLTNGDKYWATHGEAKYRHLGMKEYAASNNVDLFYAKNIFDLYRKENY